MKTTYRIIILILVIFSACIKPEPVNFSGQLLLTKKNPIPLSNREIEIFQLGGNAIITGSSGSSSVNRTDVNGRFSMTFVPGSSYFTAFRGANGSSLTLISNQGFPFFIRKNFPEQNYDSNTPIYVGKTIDSLIIKVYSFENITFSDTFGLRGITTLDSSINKRYRGITADSATTFTLDTIYNVLYTDFDCIKNKFSNNNMSFGRIRTNSNGELFSGQYLYGIELSSEDEQKKEMTFYFYE